MPGYGRQWRNTRAAILARATHCTACGEELDFMAPARSALSPSVDHVTPKARGGTDHPSNLRAIHYGCNSSRGANDW